MREGAEEGTEGRREGGEEGRKEGGKEVKRTTGEREEVGKDEKNNRDSQGRKVQSE